MEPFQDSIRVYIHNKNNSQIDLTTMNEILLEEKHTPDITPRMESSEISHYVKDIMARIEVFPVKEAMYLLHKINSKSIITTLKYSDENGPHEIVIDQFEATLDGECLYTRGRISIYTQGEIRNILLVLNQPPRHLDITLEDINICPIH